MKCVFSVNLDNEDSTIGGRKSITVKYVSKIKLAKPQKHAQKDNYFFLGKVNRKKTLQLLFHHSFILILSTLSHLVDIFFTTLSSFFYHYNSITKSMQLITSPIKNIYFNWQ